MIANSELLKKAHEQMQAGDNPQVKLKPRTPCPQHDSFQDYCVAVGLTDIIEGVEKFDQLPFPMAIEPFLSDCFNPTREEIYKLAGIDGSNFRKILRGERDVTRDIAFRVSLALHLRSQQVLDLFCRCRDLSELSVNSPDDLLFFSAILEEQYSVEHFEKALETLHDEIQKIDMEHVRPYDGEYDELLDPYEMRTFEWRRENDYDYTTDF